MSEYKPWVTVEVGSLIFEARLIGFDGGNTVVAPQRQGGVYLGLPTKHIVWDTLLPDVGHRGRLAIPTWVAKFHKQFWSE
jgi:hypothetical protein